MLKLDVHLTSGFKTHGREHVVVLVWFETRCMLKLLDRLLTPRSLDPNAR